MCTRYAEARAAAWYIRPLDAKRTAKSQQVPKAVNATNRTDNARFTTSIHILSAVERVPERKATSEDDEDGEWARPPAIQRAIGGSSWHCTCTVFIVS